MSELPSALGIEAVEWLPQAGGSLTVSVIGRWRRRRPSWGGQPQLVIEAEGTRHRFPAMPEPPSLIGAAPGTWRLSFAIPASLAPHLGGRVWLQFGAVVVPLPAAAGRPGGPEGGRESQSPTKAPERDLQAEVQRLERVRRIAEQRAHAERALRIDLEEELARVGSAAQAARQLTEAEERIAQLEDEVGFLRRRLARRTVDHQRAAATRAELAAARRRVPVAPVAPRAPAALRHDLLDAERRIIEQRRSDPRKALLAPLQRLRTHVQTLRGQVEREGARRADAERRVTQAYDAIAELREQLGHTLAPAIDPATPERGPELDPGLDRPLDAERFEVALARLRQATPPIEAETAETAPEPKAQAAPEPDAEAAPEPDAEAAPEPDAEPRTWLGRLLRRLLGGAQSG